MITKVFDVLFAKSLKKSPVVGSFLSNRNKVWTSFGHLGSLEFINFLYVLGILSSIYRKVASSRLSQLVAHPSTFRKFMNGKFDAYVL